MLQRKRIPVLLILLTVSLLIIFLDSSGRLDSFSYPLRRLLSPLQYFENNIIATVLSPIDYLRFVHSGEQRIKFLEQKNIELTIQTHEDKQLREQNDDLTKQLGTSVAKKHLLVLAEVLGIDRYLELRVNDFSKIQIGQSVVWQDNFLGTIIKTGSGVAYARLAKDPDSKIPAKTDSATGIVIGQFESGLFLDKVSKDEFLTPGDLVMTSGTSAITPPDLVIGKIERVVSSPSDLFQKAALSALVDPGKLQEVYIVVD